MPELVIVTVCPGEVCPRSTLPNWRLVGLTVMAGISTPVPASATGVGDAGALDGMQSELALAPAAVGAKATSMVAEAPGGSTWWEAASWPVAKWA
ncbi:hypothetical protein WME79_47905 [Sorangium sp. So ce726]